MRVQRRHTKPLVGKVAAFKGVTSALRLREAVMNELIAVITWSEVCAIVPTTLRRETKTAARNMVKSFIVASIVRVVEAGKAASLCEMEDGGRVQV